jgi:hypothetical protein
MQKEDGAGKRKSAKRQKEKEKSGRGHWLDNLVKSEHVETPRQKLECNRWR